MKSAGNAFVEPLNKLDLDAWTVHWDIAYGKHHLEDVAAELNCPLLAANCHSTSDSKDPFPPSITVERAGLTVGIIGVAATIIDKSFPARWSEGLRFTMGEEEVREEIRRLRKEAKADLIIMLSHLGFPQDCKFASRVEGIDVIVSGHTHNRMYEPFTVGDTTIFQSGCHGSFVGRLDVKVREDGVVEAVKHELVELNEQIEPDAEMQRLVDDIYEGHRESLAEVVGNTETDLNRYTTLESTMDNLLLDAIAASAGTEIAFSNGWRYGARIPAGPITRNDLWNIIPTNPMVQMV